MKTESTARYVARLAITLLLITSVVAAALAGINAITKDKIAAIKQANTLAAIEAVLPGGGSEVAVSGNAGNVKKVYQSDAGYAIQVTPSGFGGTIDMMVGVAKDGSVLGISIISHSETAGLGAVAAADTSAGQAFRSQFAGMSGTLAVSKDGGQVEAITGATITSRAVTGAVNEAVAYAAALG